jgi:predicted extracellular nuclease
MCLRWVLEVKSHTIIEITSVSWIEIGKVSTLSTNRNSTMSSILFLDPTIPDSQSLINGLEIDTELVVLDATKDGILQITEGLKSGIYDTIHIVSHGTAGNLKLGTAQLNSGTIQSYASLLEQWSSYLTPGADILLYGCNVAQGDAGKDFVQQLHQATGADITASDNATGNVVLGGDWNLEYSTGTITSPLAFQVGVLEAYNSVLAPFTAGDLVIYRVGDGTSGLVNTGSKVFLDEYTPSGTLVQSIAIPSSAIGANNSLIASGTATSEGLLTLSGDGKYLMLSGYNAALGSLASAPSRTVGRVDSNGVVDTSTALTDFSAGNNPRSVVSTNGTDLWVAGGAGGVRYATIGSTTSTQLSTTLTNIRQVNIFNGQLYASTGSGTTVRLGTVGSSTPTTSGQVITNLPGFPVTGSPYGFYLADLTPTIAGVDTLYVADDIANQIQKYSLSNSGNWVANGSVTATGVRGLTASTSGSTVNIFGTTGGSGATGGGSLYSFVDTTGYNANISGTASTIATAALNTAFRGIAFAPTAVTLTVPSVNLSVSNSNGSEASPTDITVTATASSAVVGNQTLTLTVTGAGITTGDYTLNNATTNTVTITILSGQTTGTATFKVVDDTLVEGLETATLTLSNLSTGIVLGSVVSQNIAIADNDVATNTAPTIVADNETTIDPEKVTVYLSAPDNSPISAPTALISGVIDDPTDPAKSIGIEFNIADAETPNALTITATSSNTAVVANANLTITGTGISRNLKINPTGVGYSDITVTVSDGALSSSYVIKYAASAAGLSTSRFLTGASNASTAIAIDTNYMLVGDDENQALRLYNRTNSGLAVNSFDYTNLLDLTDLSGGLPREVDIEASARVGNRIFWAGSQSNTDPDGKLRPNRDRIFATDITGTGASTNLAYAGRYDFLREDIIAWDVNNSHGKGADYYGLAASAAVNVSSKQNNGYNIEGLEFAPDNTTAYIAFRAPQEPTGTRTKALIIPVANFTTLLNTAGGGTQGSATFGAPIELDLGGRGIREIRKNAANQYVIIAGPAGDATGVAPNDFQLYTWTGNVADAPVFRATDLTALNVGGSFESIVEVPTNVTSTSQLQLLVDNGSTIFYNDGLDAKSVPANFQKSRSEIVSLGNPITKIHDIQGSGATAALLGSQSIEGIVTRVFAGAGKLNGFYVQEEDADADNNAATSEAIFVFDTTGKFTGNVGDKVRVTGIAKEFTSTSNGNNSSLTELDITSGTVLNLGASTLPTVTNIQIPVSNATDLERYEGMLVNISAIAGDLTVTENFQLGRFGQVVLAATNASNQPGTDARFDQYTQFNAPSVSGYAAYLADQAKRKIYLDDGSSTQNGDPILFGRGGNPLGATNTLRSGDTVNNITGILDERFEGYRIQTTAPVNFSPTNARPVTAPAVGGTLRVANFNILNYFTDLLVTPTTTFVNDSGQSLNPRGANTAAEFTRQRDKIVQAIINSGADVLGLNEVENNGFGANSAIKNLVDGLNAVAGAGTYAYINPGVNISTDAITVGMIYKPGKVTPVGNAATIALGVSAAFDLVGRRPLAQTFQQNSNQELFTAVVNHLKSKGSSAGGIGDADAGDGQGLSNGTRTREAQDLATWLATKPTGTTDPDYIILGDLNAYAKEDPLTTLATAGYSNLLPDTSYSYVFDGQAGSLDHALGSNSLANQVTGADKWHINADEPNALDYEIVLDNGTVIKSPTQISSLYSPDQYRASDHDPVIVGLDLRSNIPAVRNDFGGDQRSDILWRNTDGSVALWQMNKGSIQTANIVSAGVDVSWEIAGTGDFNGDKKADMLWRNADGSVALWQMNGGNIQAANIVSAGVDNNWKIASTGDFNGDGKSDIFWKNTDGYVAIWQMDGGNIQSAKIVGTGVDISWQVTGTGDFNGDGKADILWRNTDGTVAIWQMDGAALLSAAVINKPPNDWKIVGVDDFVGDSKADILWRNVIDGSLAYWQMDSFNVLASPVFGSVSGDWNVTGTGDFNRDGKSDILWRNNDGTVGLWQMNGTNIIDSNIVAGVPNNWQIAAPII